VRDRWLSMVFTKNHKAPPMISGYKKKLDAFKNSHFKVKRHLWYDLGELRELLFSLRVDQVSKESIKKGKDDFSTILQGPIYEGMSD
jgi:hypothetical protein